MQNFRLFAVVVCLAPFPTTHAQTAAPMPRHHSLSLEAQSVANGGKASLTNGSQRHDTVAQPLIGGGSSSVSVVTMHDRQDVGNRNNVQVSIRNLGAIPDTVKLEWYFIAVPVGDTARQHGTKDFVFDRGAQDVTVRPNETETRAVSSAEIKAVTTRSSQVINGTDGGDITYAGGLNAVGQVSTHGYKTKGWFVRLVADGGVVATHGSSETYEEIAKDDGKLKALLAQSAAMHGASSDQ